MFWDSSAVVPTLLPEGRSAEMTAALESDREPMLWWGSPVECQSAIHRRHRESPLSSMRMGEAFHRLQALLERGDFVAASLEVRDRAGRLLADHPLRAGDALQLSAALQWCGERPAGEAFVSLDDRLREAARRAGFTVRPD